MVDNVKLAGVDTLLKEMKAFGPTVAEKGGKKGVTKGAQMLRKHLRAAAPPGETKRLRKAINIRRTKRRGVAMAWVALSEIKGDVTRKGAKAGRSTQVRAYYKTLENPSKRGAPLHPFWDRTVNRSSRAVQDEIMKYTREAMYIEAGKTYARSRMKRGRF